MDDLISRQAMPEDGDLISRRSLLRNILKRLGIKGQEYFTAQESVVVDCIYAERPIELSHWVPCSERLPKTKYDDGIPSEEKFIVTVKETWNNEEPKYHTDLAWNLGDYIDDFWDTYNDWKEGQDVHVIAWMPSPEPYNPDDLSQHMNQPED